MLIKVAKYLPASFRFRKFFEFKTGLELAESGLFVRRNMNVLAVLGTPEGNLLIPAANIVTDAGDIWYAQKAMAVTPTNTFANMVLGTGKTGAWAKNGSPSTYVNLTGPVSGSNKAVAGTYPKLNDADTDNPSPNSGANIVSWLFSYSAADFTQTGTSMTDGLVTIASPSSGSPLLCGFTFGTAFTKAATDTLKVFVNHQILGS